MRPALAALATAAALALLAPAAALAAPVISNTSFSAVGETGATLEASVDPNNANVEARFDYTTKAAFDAEGFQGAASVPAGGIAVPSKVKGTGDLEASGHRITGVVTEAGAFGPGQKIEGEGIPPGSTITGVEEAKDGTLVLFVDNLITEKKTGVALTATGPQPISARLEGLAPGTAYVFRAAARKAAGANREEAQGPAVPFSTLAPAPSFDPCPNDAFRSGAYSPPTHPGALLPDCRSFELASPLAKNGNDMRSYPSYGLAGTDGTVTFGATFGLPGGVGAQNLPFYLATRSPDGSGWSSTGLLPPAELGDEVSFLVGRLPDLSATYATATHLELPHRSALFELHADGAPPTQITPYVDPGSAGAKNNYAVFGFAGASSDAATLVIESRQALPAEEGGALIPGGVLEAPNVYAWDRPSGRLSLAGRMNSIAQTEALLPEGAFAGPYNWFGGLKAEGGAVGRYYLEDEHAVTGEGSVFFTSASDGKLYERLHPTQPQSALDGEGRCTEPEKACTIEVSASHRSEPDPAGEEPAAFQAATAEGSQVLFTSHEKLTDDANTGPEQPKAAIGRATLHGEEPADGEEDEFLPTTHALGTAVDASGEHLYWVDPSRGTISRAQLDAEGNVVPNSAEAEFVVPGETEAELHQFSEPGVKTPVPTIPRYVTVGPCAGGGECVYWTNTGPAGEDRFGNQLPTIDGQGTIGRAVLTPDRSAVEGDPEPEFIAGASNPQGIAVNSEHVYWGNAANEGGFKGGNRTISRATLDGSVVDAQFVNPGASRFPYGLALDSEYLYFAVEEAQTNRASILRVPLTGGEPEGIGVGENGVRGIAIGDGYLYWVAPMEGTIGRIAASDVFHSPEPDVPDSCGFRPSCDKEFLTPPGQLEGLAADPAGSHLFWSSNGETPKNPGTDLYRFTPGPGGGTLEDLTADPSTPNGAEVQGVLGTSADGSYVYLAANADLDGSGPAEAGDCEGKFPNATGRCSIYLRHEGQFEFVARVDVGGEDRNSDILNWLPRVDGSTDAKAIKSSLVSPDGRALIFKAASQIYRFRLDEGTTCLSCRPTGEAPGREPTLGSAGFPFLNPGAALGTYRVGFASTDGDRLFFETSDALVPQDTDGAGGCAVVPVNYGLPDNTPSCLDVYEWEAPGSGTCKEGGPGYAALNGGCIYLISPGSEGPSLFLNASPSGRDLYLITRLRLVGSDTDALADVYDARVEGGIAAQNQPPPPPPCEGEGCKPAASPPPAFQAPPQFAGPPNPKPKRCHGKRCHRKRHGQGHHHRKKHHHRKARNGVGGDK